MEEVLHLIFMIFQISYRRADAKFIMNFKITYKIGSESMTQIEFDIFNNICEIKV